MIVCLSCQAVGKTAGRDLCKKCYDQYRLRLRYDEWTIPEPNTGCFLWFGAIDRAGYGRIKVSGSMRLVHRLTWELFVGPIPRNLLVLHTCDNPPCVNISHLFVGNQTDNMIDMARKGRSRRGEKHRCAKLTEGDVANIRSSTMRQKELAEMYRVSQSTVSSIISRRIWRHIA